MKNSSRIIFWVALLTGTCVYAETSCVSNIDITSPTTNFTIFDNGIVYDETTGLQWMRCSVGQSWNQQTSFCDGSAEFIEWKDALQFTNGYSYAGYEDWRLPNVKELISISEDSCTFPAVNTTIFPNTPSSWYLTSTPHTNIAEYVWFVDTYDGSAFYQDKISAAAIRLVRGAEQKASTIKGRI